MLAITLSQLHIFLMAVLPASLRTAKNYTSSPEGFMAALPEVIQNRRHATYFRCLRAVDRFLMGRARWHSHAMF